SMSRPSTWAAARTQALALVRWPHGSSPACRARTEADMAWRTRFAQQVRVLTHRGGPPSSDAATHSPTSAPPSAPAHAPTPAGAALVLGASPQMTDAEQALSNLDEAGYQPHTISVITTDPKRTHTLTDRKGPLASVPADALPAHLQALGLSTADAESYQ